MTLIREEFSLTLWDFLLVVPAEACVDRQIFFTVPDMDFTFYILKGSIKNNLGICWRIFRIVYHAAKEEHILRYLTIAQRDKRPEERQPLGTGIQAFVFCVASPFTYARYAQGLRLKYKRLYFPSNAQVIFNRALRKNELI